MYMVLRSYKTGRWVVDFVFDDLFEAENFIDTMSSAEAPYQYKIVEVEVVTLDV